MLYLVGTPIGNLEDITFRAIQTLSTVDKIYCEDTRRSKILLSHYGIEKPLCSFHKFNEQKRSSEILTSLEEGAKIAIISDAGMPCISDPGEKLVQEVRKRGLLLTAIPGPSAITTALALSGHSSPPFQFVGYIDPKTKIDPYLSYPGITIAFVAPHDIKKVVDLFPKSITLHIARELTKKFEEITSGNASELTSLKEKGEMVMMFQGARQKQTRLTPSQKVKRLIESLQLPRPLAKSIVQLLEDQHE